MSFPGVGAERRECLVCGKVFLIYRVEALKYRRGYFCSSRCQSLGMGLFWQALANINVEMERLSRS
jgi:hypothetical protein